MEIDRTVQAVYDKAIYLIDSQGDNGQTITTDNEDYRVRTAGILNTLLDVVYPASDTYEITEDGKRPALPDVTAFTDELDLDPRILRDVLPNGLAAKLISEENPQLASYFQQTFEENLAIAMRSKPAVFEDIYSDYGGIEHGQFSRDI